MINNKLTIPKDEKQKSGASLYSLLKAHPKWWMLYDVTIAISVLKIVCLCYAKYMQHHFFLIEYFGFPIFFLVAGSITGLYERNAFNSFIKLFLSLFATAILALIGLVLLKNVFLYEQIGRYVLFFIFIGTVVSCGLMRLILGSYIRRFAVRILFVGDKKQALDFENYFGLDARYYTLVGYCDDGLQPEALRLGNISDIDKICSEQEIDLLVIDNYIGRVDIFEKCLSVLKLNCVVMDKETFIEQGFEQVAVDKVDPVWFYRANLGAHNDFQFILKRAVDVFFAIIGLLFTALIYPFIWVVIKLNSSGSVLYSQIRCGRFDNEFKIYKFRTMRVDAEMDSGAVWAKQNDERITAIGKVLRKTRLDELPQFWNVLIGDMSLVGPRPERPELVKKIEEQIPYFYFRHLVKPGITGFAQIRYRYGASVEDAKEKLKYDLYYVKNWSFFMDIQIILRTIVTVMRGAR